MNDMNGKVALVTGGGSGIGRETSLLFARRGASVVVADINLDNAQTVAAAIEAAGGRALALRVEVTDESSVQSMVAQAVERFGAGALEVETRGVRVNAVCPGFTVTPMLTDQGLKLKPGTEAYAAADSAHPIGRMGRASEIAESIVWLASDSASFVTGTCLSVDGGFTAR